MNIIFLWDFYHLRPKSNQAK